MDIAVLIKSVIATDEPIFVRDGKIDDIGVKKVLNPYDEYGLEEALRIKEAHGGTVTVISVGTERCIETLRTALAMGADEALWIHVREHSLDERGADGQNSTRLSADEHTVSLLLASAIRERGFPLVFAGHLSIDNGAGQVAIRVAELLGWPHAGAIVSCQLVNSAGGSENGAASGAKLLVTRDAEGDSESWELPLPALLTAQQGLNEPRYPALAGIMKAKRKLLTELSPEELGVELSRGAAAPRTERIGCDAPPARPSGRKLSGAAREQAVELLSLLRNEAQVLKER
ncbi:electron transfer flavoprotein subunit beta/FixA family protein [Cohnella sp. WQ 127256]|uniref:electron transfer flavoprotein subunit beta/FixA family protein n=1 Tax=Cohnella sp. WQ 127256 TaxID=2938790 RepID=UPI0021196CA9